MQGKCAEPSPRSQIWRYMQLLHAQWKRLKHLQLSIAYGSYEEMVSDPAVDLIHTATPHSHHYDHAMLAPEHGKPVLVGNHTGIILSRR